MTHFEAYRWEDHVPRAGSWKFNLAAGSVALGLIAAALPDTSGDMPAAASAAGAPSRHVEISERPTVQPVNAQRAYCPTTAVDTADSREEASGGRPAHRSPEVFALERYFAMQVSAVSGVHTSRPV